MLIIRPNNIETPRNNSYHNNLYEMIYPLYTNIDKISKVEPNVL